MAFRDYLLRLQMTRASPDLVGLYSLARPLIYVMRDLFSTNTVTLGVIVVFAFLPAAGFLMLFFQALNWFQVFLNLSESVAFDPILFSELMNVWIKRLVFYGVNAVLLWTFVFWSAMNLFRTHEMRKLVQPERIDKALEARFGILGEQP